MGIAKLCSTTIASIAKVIGASSLAKVMGAEWSSGGVTSKLLMHFDQTYPYKDEISGATFADYAIEQTASGKFGYAVQTHDDGYAQLYTIDEDVLANIAINVQQGISVECFFKGTPSFTYTAPAPLMICDADYQLLTFYIVPTSSTDIMAFMMVGNEEATYGGLFEGVVADVTAWNHVVFQYDGDAFKIGIAGTIVHSEPITPSNLPDLSLETIAIVYVYPSGGSDIVRALDELRVLDQPWFTGDVDDPYTVPTEPYSS